MNDCKCGKPVRLGAYKVTINRRHGVMHYVAHRDGTGDCDHIKLGAWECVAMKPYPKVESEKEYSKLIARWDAA